MAIRVLELGSYVAPAFCGMLLAEQGCLVEKWIAPSDDGYPRDPIYGLDHGPELWRWINHGKLVLQRDARELGERQGWPRLSNVDIVIDNFRPSTLERWGLEPAVLAERAGVVWVSLRSEVGEYSFDVVAQARAWMEYVPWLPFYIGDTAPGALMAFKAITMYALNKRGHYVLGQATCLQKLVEGELQVLPDAQLLSADHHLARTRWDPRGSYEANGQGAHVDFRGTLVEEPVRDRQWKLANLWHTNGRMHL